MPMVVVSRSGTPRTSIPPVISRADPRAMPSVPRVTISGGTLALVTSTPLRTPQAVPATSPAASPGRIAPQPSPPTASITLAAITPEKTSTDPTDRSIPAVMITKVMPTAMISSPEASAAMLRKLNTVANCWKRRAAKPATMPSRIRNVQVVVSVSRRRSTPRRPFRAGASAPSSWASAGTSRVSLIGAPPRGSPNPSGSSGHLPGLQGAGHGRDDLLHGGVGGPVAGHPDPEPQHLDAVGQLHHLGQVVADEHDRDPRVADPADQVADVAGLDHAQGGGGLVHEHDLADPGGGPADGDALALAARQVGHHGPGVLEPDAEVGEGLVSPAAHGRLVQEPEPAERPGADQLAAEEQVGRRVELGRQRQVLVHGLDAELAGRHRVRDGDLAALEPDLAAIGGEGARQDLDQRALAGPVVADQGRHLPRVDGEVDAPQRPDAAEALRDAARLQQRFAHRRLLSGAAGADPGSSSIPP